MTRGRVAIAILAVWAGAIALLIGRRINRDPVEVLALAALGVQPRAYYYTVEHDGAVVGAASSEIDTVTVSLTATDYLEGLLPFSDSLADVRIRSRSRFTRALALNQIDITIASPGDSLRVSAMRLSDSVLRVTGERDNQLIGTQEVTAPNPVFMPQWAGLVLMLVSAPEVGAKTTVRILDPMARMSRTVPLRIDAESVFVVVDSARFDAVGKRWVAAHRDTVRAWRVTSDSFPSSAWLDAGARIVDADNGAGLRFRRTAYEIAFDNWRNSRRVTRAARERP